MLHALVPPLVSTSYGNAVVSSKKAWRFETSALAFAFQVSVFGLPAFCSALRSVDNLRVVSLSVLHAVRFLFAICFEHITGWLSQSPRSGGGEV